MEVKHAQAQARALGQKNNKKAKNNAKGPKGPGKTIQKSKIDDRGNEEDSNQPPKFMDSELNHELQKAESDVKMKLKVSTTEKKDIRIKSPSGNKDGDKKQKPIGDKAPTKQETAFFPNIVKAAPSEPFLNEHKARGFDKEGSGSEDGYIMPKKRKAKRKINRAGENLNLRSFKTIPPTPKVPALQQDFENLKLYSRHQRGMRVENPKSVLKSEKWAVGEVHSRPEPGHMLEKAFNTNPVPNSPKVNTWPKIVPTSPVIPREEAWSLFKQSTVFSMGNSNAPKVTYASKVKQNLYRVQNPSVPLGSYPQSELAPQSVAALSSSSAIIGTPMLMPSNSLTHMPKSSLKAVSSQDFTNGPEKSINTESMQALPLEARLIRRPSSTPASVRNKIKSSFPPGEKGPLLRSSNMPAAPMSLTPKITSPQRQAQILKKIFQNEWGLSFITEPISSTEIAQDMEPDPKLVQPEVDPSPLAPQETNRNPCIPEPVLLPKVYNMRKWLNPQDFEVIIKPPAPKKEGDILILDPSLGDDPKNHEAFTPLPSKHKMEKSEPLYRNRYPVSTLKDSKQKNARELFNARAAIKYHMAEMQSILEMQKKEPQKIIFYDESMDSPAP